MSTSSCKHILESSPWGSKSCEHILIYDTWIWKYVENVQKETNTIFWRQHRSSLPYFPQNVEFIWTMHTISFMISMHKFLIDNKYQQQKVLATKLKFRGSAVNYNYFSLPWQTKMVSYACRMAPYKLILNFCSKSLYIEKNFVRKIE